MSLSSEEIANRAKTADFIIRSVTSSALAIGLVGALIWCAVTGHPLSGEVSSALLTAVGLVVGFFFGNNATVNGSLLRSVKGSRATDNVSEGSK